MAVIGAMIGEGARKDSSLLEMQVIINIAASAFLAYLAAFGLMSLGSVHDGILISLSGLLGYLGDQYSKGWLLKALKRYDNGEIRISEKEALKEKKEALEESERK
ncbi:hypothetical protein [Isachenkonia alkalipeptolytica]|uniref:Holin n=1 Tax=Isachenkonia alkalipeptolytica TaxID=2565777 RepID=A0AA44BEV6_9CLOT|nr:hypothetical protein [Isachenkonia alkalipeptolytica]NBG89338.1 hypothetical protein [Isachenkonia alkalipeptolytica]